MNTLLLSSFAVISGDALINAVIWLVVAGLICWLLWWFLGYVGLPEPFNKVGKVIIALVALVICINVLLTIAGHPIIRW